MEKKIITDISRQDTDSGNKRLKLAYISPLPPEKSGISDYSAELLPGLYHYYDIDVVVDQENISDQWILDHCSIVDVQTFRENGNSYDRVLYHFGNSHFHKHMFDLLLEIPGVVVLHDFYLSGVINYMSTMNYKNHSFEDELFYSHGNTPFNRDGYDLITEYPSNKKVLDYAKGIIVHSENSVRLAKEWYGKLYGYDWSVIPLLRKPFIINDRNKSRRKLDIPENAIVIASFGHLYSTKLNKELLEVWLDSSISKNENCFLIFVGEISSNNYSDTIQNLISSSTYSNRIKITGWIDLKTFRDYLSAADIGVQLRTLSRGETSGAVLDCMNYGLATIMNANGSMADIPKEAVWMLPDKFSKTELMDALESLYKDENRRKILGNKALNTIKKMHAPHNCANQYVQAIETYYAKKILRKEGLVELRAKAAVTEAELTESKRRANDALHHYHMATHSLSWKITKPLRYLMKNIKSISGTKS